MGPAEVCAGKKPAHEISPDPTLPTEYVQWADQGTRYSVRTERAVVAVGGGDRRRKSEGSAEAAWESILPVALRVLSKAGSMFVFPMPTAP